MTRCEWTCDRCKYSVFTPSEEDSPLGWAYYSISAADWNGHLCSICIQVLKDVLKNKKGENA